LLLSAPVFGCEDTNMHLRLLQAAVSASSRAICFEQKDVRNAPGEGDRGGRLYPQIQSKRPATSGKNNIKKGECRENVGECRENVGDILKNLRVFSENLRENLKVLREFLSN